MSGEAGRGRAWFFIWRTVEARRGVTSGKRRGAILTVSRRMGPSAGPRHTSPMEMHAPSPHHSLLYSHRTVAIECVYFLLAADYYLNIQGKSCHNQRAYQCMQATVSDHAGGVPEPSVPRFALTTQCRANYRTHATRFSLYRYSLAI